MSNGIVYDEARVCDLLGLTVATDARTAPAAGDGEIVIWSPGLSLQALRGNLAVPEKKLLWADHWYDKYPWSSVALPIGYHAVRMPVPGSNRKKFTDQVKLLQSGEQPIPVALAVLTWCVHRAVTGEDLLKGDFTRCSEQTPDGYRIGARVDEGQLRGSYCWDDLPLDFVFLSSSRRAS